MVKKLPVATLIIGSAIDAVKLDTSRNTVELEEKLSSVSQITDCGKYILFGPNDVKILDNVKNIFADVVLTGEKKFVFREWLVWFSMQSCVFLVISPFLSCEFLIELTPVNIWSSEHHMGSLSVPSHWERR
ncbi:hypothetical protein H5410_050370, partial [Solanum commersonii]